MRACVDFAGKSAHPSPETRPRRSGGLALVDQRTGEGPEGVLGVEAWTTIRYLNAQGVGIRAICRELRVSRTAVRHALRSEGPPRYQRPARPNPQLVPYEAQIYTW